MDVTTSMTNSRHIKKHTVELTNFFICVVCRSYDAHQSTRLEKPVCMNTVSACDDDYKEKVCKDMFGFKPKAAFELVRPKAMFELVGPEDVFELVRPKVI